ncbi:MAG: hypothetical protein JST14_01405 [Bacteroidetes bacterium]|nr:hypothetical protein [Bacteroidota bacterium]
MKARLFILTLLFPCLQSNSQDKRISLMCLEQANEMNKAYLRDDLETYLDFMYPPAVEAFGGRQLLLESLRKNRAKALEMGIAFEELSCKEPGTIFEKRSITHDRSKVLQCLLPQRQVTKDESGKETVDGDLFAISENDGKKWFFFNMSWVPRDRISKYIPGFDERILTNKNGN